MTRVAALFVLFGTIWLAYTAVPEADAQRRLERIVGIAIGSDPNATAANSNQTRATPAMTPYRPTPQVFGLTPTNQPTRTRPATSADVFALRAVPTPQRKPKFNAPNLRIANAEIADHVATPVFELAAARTTVVPTPVLTLQQGDVPLDTSDPDASLADQGPPQPKMSRRERRRVARHIQRELHRVGCYSGSVDGVWGQQSKAALQKFADNISAKVPLAQPDYVALMLVETFDARACTGNNNASTHVVAQPATPSPALLSRVTNADYASRILPDLPEASPRRSTKRYVRAAPSRRKVTRRVEKPRVASVATRKQKSSSASVAKARDLQKTKRLAAKRTAIARQRDARRLRARNKRRARAATKRRRIAAVRAQRKARLRLARAKRKRAARQRVATRRRSPRRTAGFRRSGRAWVRHAFTAKR